MALTAAGASAGSLRPWVCRHPELGARALQELWGRRRAGGGPATNTVPLPVTQNDHMYPFQHFIKPLLHGHNRTKPVEGHRVLVTGQNKTKKPQKLWLGLSQVLSSLLCSYFENSCRNVKHSASSKGCLIWAHFYTFMIISLTPSFEIGKEHTGREQ